MKHMQFLGSPGVPIRHCRNRKQWNGLWSQSYPAFQPLSALGLCRWCKVLPNQHRCSGVRKNTGKWGRRPLPMRWLDQVHCKWGTPGCRGAENPRVGETCTCCPCLQNSWFHPRNTLSLNIFFLSLVKDSQTNTFSSDLSQKACRGF